MTVTLLVQPLIQPLQIYQDNRSHPRNIQLILIKYFTCQTLFDGISDFNFNNAAINPTTPNLSGQSQSSLKHCLGGRTQTCPQKAAIFQYLSFFFITFAVMVYYCTEYKSWKAERFLSRMDTMDGPIDHMPSKRLWESKCQILDFNTNAKRFGGSSLGVKWLKEQFYLADFCIIITHLDDAAEQISLYIVPRAFFL